jgi:hypothetical protein
MRFFSPLSLLWTLPIAGAIIALYMLKLRRRDVVVSSTLLWKQVIRDVQANAPFQKLRKSLLLFLQLIAVGLLGLAVAGPHLRSRAMGGRSLVLVVDTSASMSATGKSGKRIDLARKAGYDLINSMKLGDQMLVIQAGARPEALSGFTSETSTLNQALERATPHDTGSGMREALSLGAALSAGRPGSLIHVLTDGGFPDVTGVSLGQASVQFHPIGEAVDNTGIVALDVRRSRTEPDTAELFATVHNYGTKPAKFNLELHREGALVDAQEVDLPAQQEKPYSFDISGLENEALYSVRIDVDDALAADNQGAVVVAPNRMVQVLLVSDGDANLEAGLAADPNVEVTVRKLSALGDTKPFDVVVFDRHAPAKLPPGNYLFAQCTSSAAPIKPKGEDKSAAMVDFDRGHPALRSVEFGSLRWSSMQSAQPLSWAREIASSEQGACIVAGEQAGARTLWLGFGLTATDSGFPQTVGYPIFLSNAVRWLASLDDSLAGAVQTGRPVSIQAPGQQKQLTVTLPGANAKTVSADNQGRMTLNAAERVGEITLAGKDFKRRIAANLADPVESDLSMKKLPELAQPAATAGRPVLVLRDLWPYLAILGLALLALEWWVYHRRAFVT